ncbi:MAG TPA: PorV/PorQ family protein [Caldithrix abyssi]|uniref:PorV/PorQ family protein n=1 Tax=Caldithrix abyssi TaxID=187145 RepID=A0A7V4UDF2_CALAY|nr:PorV/PorQ family protein [Caldithrix abyssi]
MKLKVVLSILLLLSIGAFAQDDFSKVGTGTAQFLKLGAGARGTALGDAYSALVNDATAMYWNPSGIQKVNQFALSVSRTYLFAGINYDFLGAVIPIDNNTSVGVSVLYLSSGDIERTTIEDPEGTGDTFDTGHSAIGITVARSLTTRFDLGVTIKYISERLFREEASTIAFDIGSQFDTGIYGIKLGMVLSNFGGKMKFDGPDLNQPIENDQTSIRYENGGRWKTEEWPIPLLFRLGVRTDLLGAESEFMYSESNRLTLLLEGNDPIDHVLRYNIGMEYEWNAMLAFRAGYKINYDQADITAGVGFDLTRLGINLKIDYAFNNYGLLGYVHNYTLEFKF